MNRQKTKIEEEKKRGKDFNINIDLTQKDEQNKEMHEKKKKLKLISSGIYEDTKRFDLIENKIYKNILTVKTQKTINKLDKTLLSLAYSDNNVTQKKGLQKTLSLNIMDNLCHYKMYNKLMSNKYHDFIMTNNNLKLSNPKDQEEFIQNIHSYLTSTMEIKPQNEKSNKNINLYKEKTLKNSLSSGNILKTTNKTKAKISSARTPRSPQMINKHFFDSFKKNIINSKFNKKIFKKPMIKKNNSFASLKIDIPKTTNNFQSNTINKSLSETCITSKTGNIFNSKSKFITKSKFKTSNYTYFSPIKNKKTNSNSIKAAIKNNYLSPKYFKKYMYLDKLIKKELDFQKIILGLKSNNSKLYYKRFYKELFVDPKDKEEETIQNYLMIDEKINEKVQKNLKEYEKMMNNNVVKKKETINYKYILKLKKGHNFFNSPKTTGSSFVDNDFFDCKKKSNYNVEDEDKDIKKNNEKSLFSLNEKIKNIRNKINDKKEKLKYH